MLRVIRPGDWLTLALAALLVGASFPFLWSSERADRAVVRSAGRVVAELPLSRDQSMRVAGPLGESVIAVRQGRARVESDPSPRQYCVRQGWLERAGDMAICLPNQVSLELAGRGKPYDSISY